MIKNFFKGLSAHIILILVCILSLLPFIWLLSTALKGAQENIFQYPPEFLPKFPTLDSICIRLCKDFRVVCQICDTLCQNSWHTTPPLQIRHLPLQSLTIKKDRLERSFLWWALEDSNFWPSPCKGDALPTELNALAFRHLLSYQKNFAVKNFFSNLVFY